MMKSTVIHASLHERVARQILHDFRGLPQGARLDPMRALARRYEVSLVTVREALMLLEREGGLELRHGSGCYVARPQAPDRHIAILVELDILKPGTSPYFRSIVNRLRRSFSDRQKPFRLHIGFAVEPEDSYGDPTCHGFLEDLENDHVSGVVAVATLPRSKLLAPVKERKIPSVGMDFSGLFDASVCLDYSGMLRLGAETLIAQGCRRLAMVGWGYPRLEDRRLLDDFEQTVTRHGLVFRSEWVRTAIPSSRRGAGWDDFREIWSTRREKPDGLFIADDMLLADVDLAMRELHIDVPRDLKVVLATSRCMTHVASFPLTRLENDPEELADKMVDLLLELMDGREPADRRPVVGYEVAEEGAATLEAHLRESVVLA